MTDRIVVLCTVSRCDEPSLFSTVGLVGGRFYAQCQKHALSKAEQALARAEEDARHIRAVVAALPGQEALPL